MAISKQRKDELIAQYTEWLEKSRALVITEYLGVSMKQIDDLRLKVREAGGEVHIVKNTLGRVAFEKAGMQIPEGFLEGSTAVAFAFKDAPAMAKTITDLKPLYRGLSVSITAGRTSPAPKSLTSLK